MGGPSTVGWTDGWKDCAPSSSTFALPKSSAYEQSFGAALGVDVQSVVPGGGHAAEGSDDPPDPGAASKPPPQSQTALAFQDLIKGARGVGLWGMLGWQDIRRRYRRSTLGPFWLTISMGALVAGLGLLYSSLFKIDIAEYLPYITVGFIVWGLISGLIIEGCAAFTGAEAIIKQVDLPLSVHVYRVVWRNVIISAHNTVIYVVVAAVFVVWPGWAGFLALPGLMLLVFNGVWVGLLFGLLSARFRDVPQIAASLVRAVFFLTPIIWKAESLPDRAFVLDFNPFHHFIELVRAPLLGQVPDPLSWLVALGFTLGGWFVTLLMYRHYSWRIAYWV